MKVDLRWTMHVVNYITDMLKSFSRCKVMDTPPKGAELVATLRIYRNRHDGCIYYRIGNHNSRTSGTWLCPKGEQP